MGTTGMFGLPTETVEKLRHVFQQHPSIQRALIYGSRAKGNYRPASDIDLTIEGEALGLTELFTIETQIDDLLLPWMVDLSLLHQIDNPDLVEHIRRVGMTFYEKSTTARAQN